MQEFLTWIGLFPATPPTTVFELLQWGIGVFISLLVIAMVFKMVNSMMTGLQGRWIK